MPYLEEGVYSALYSSRPGPHFQPFPLFLLEACRLSIIANPVIPYLGISRNPTPQALLWYTCQVNDEADRGMDGPTLYCYWRWADMLSGHPYPCQSHHRIQAPPTVPPSRTYLILYISLQGESLDYQPQHKWTRPTTTAAPANDDESHHQRHRSHQGRRKLRLQHA